MNVAPKPNVLVSSTIYDFCDLRSALRYWLSELGYDVMLSEFNDFPKALGENSYESCLNAIRRADYFVLLIGARTGGWADERNRISITRMEYRAALESFEKTGRPKLAIFVRRNLWDIREDRAALIQHLTADHLLSREIPEPAKTQLQYHPSKFVNDAETVFAFLREVGQVDRMKAAVIGGGALPKANWIHQFTDFSEIVSALRVAFGVSSSIEHNIITENLRQEFTRNLGELLWKAGGESPLRKSSLTVSPESKLSPRIDGESLVRRGDLVRLCMFLVVSTGAGNRLGRIFLEQAIHAGTFMQINPKDGTCESTPVHKRLLELLDLISRAQRLDNSSAKETQRFIQKFQQNGRNLDEKITVKSLEIALPLSFAGILGRITDLTARMLQYLNGDNAAIEKIGTWSPSPFSEEAAFLQRDEISSDNIRAFIADFT